jgi:hypothetical protein
LVDGVEGLVDGVEGLVDGVEGLVDGVEGLVDGLETEGWEGLVVGRDTLDEVTGLREGAGRDGFVTEPREGDGRLGAAEARPPPPAPPLAKPRASASARIIDAQVRQAVRNRAICMV